jgi:hypothetical protein
MAHWADRADGKAAGGAAGVVEAVVKEDERPEPMPKLAEAPNANSRRERMTAHQRQAWVKLRTAETPPGRLTR